MSLHSHKITFYSHWVAPGCEDLDFHIDPPPPPFVFQVWVTASTSAGEGPASHRLNLTPAHSSSHPPLTLGGGREWWVARGGGLTLGCRRVGRPVPTLQWVRTVSAGPGVEVGARGGSEQQLPGGDLHVSGNSLVREINVCWPLFLLIVIRFNYIDMNVYNVALISRYYMKLKEWKTCISNMDC